ncbi:type II toxin-antitoxin system RelE/ParE family toxin [Pedobacter frigidisoli]|uniref:Type II toxin-antitoxin system RelE/ParE family toxin n=1 Tax=Pedobacter frigidisoli TaxID=2530455 RepID=A0A4R0NXY6_9SPHI|nr:type II toxin-antitoxin system RelE/ParE family toxin [Pedobacter frigidisoli]
MPLTIVWTETAKETYIYVLDYLDEFWGKKHVNNFIKKTDKVFKLVASNPQMFHNIYENDSVRKGLLHKNCAFLYRISEENIELLAFWDTRQEPFL